MQTAAASIRDVRFIAESDRGYLAYRSRCIAERRARAAAFHGAALPEFAAVRTLVSNSDSWNGGSAQRIVLPPLTAAANETFHRAERDNDVSRVRPLMTAARNSACPPTRTQIGRLVERAARHWLGFHVKLEQNRILAWREPDETGRHTLKYQEIDAVCSTDYDSVTLYEIKFTSLERMQRGEGRYQLERAAATLRAHQRIRSVRQRLIYVGDTVDCLLSGAVSVKAADQDAPFGTLWISPEEIEWAARDRGIDLPESWAA